MRYKNRRKYKLTNLLLLTKIAFKIKIHAKSVFLNLYDRINIKAGLQRSAEGE